MISTDEVANEAQSPLHRKLRVFVSYSRDDVAFADEIVGGLEYDGNFEVSIDRASIHEGEKWRRRLRNLIANADTIVFVLSPASARSDTCKWEVDVAAELSKRILPVQSAPLGDAEIPEQLSELNYIRFDPAEDGRPRSFIQALTSLRRALNTNIGWLREHTRLLTRAQEWESAGRAENRLLLGVDVALAKSWLQSVPKEAPKPTELHVAYINASEIAESLRNNAERQRATAYQRVNRRLKWVSILAVCLATGAGTAGYQAYLKSVEATELATKFAALRVQLEKGLSPKIPKDENIKAPTVGLFPGRFSGKAVVEMLDDGRQVRLLQALSFKDSAGRIWTAPASSVSDGASIPRSLWTVLGAPFSGNFTRPSIIHDHYVQTRERSWEDTHKMFYEALLASGVSKTKAQIIYAAVVRFGPRWVKKN